MHLLNLIFIQFTGIKYNFRIFFYNFFTLPEDGTKSSETSLRNLIHTQCENPKTKNKHIYYSDHGKTWKTQLNETSCALEWRTQSSDPVIIYSLGVILWIHNQLVKKDRSNNVHKIIRCSKLNHKRNE